MDPRPVIITDSRGRYMDWFLQQEVDYPPTVLVYSGTNLRRIRRQVSPWLKTHKVSAIYILVGINDTTWRDKARNRVYARHYTPTELRDDLTDKVEDLVAFFHDSHAVDKVVMMPIPGINLAAYNGDERRDPRQSVIDKGLEALNSNIITRNAAYDLHTPLIHTTVRKSMGHGVHRYFYNRLYDGLHPSWMTLARWSNGILKAMHLNGDLDI